MDNAKIGKLIYNLRKNAKLTQNQLAEKLNVSDKAISKWKIILFLYRRWIVLSGCVNICFLI